MKLISCYVRGFGSLTDREFGFKDGVNEIFLQNGAGKSTLAAFLKSMFYGLPTDKKTSRFNDRRHFYPFSGGAFGGSLTFEWNGRQYRVERSFDKNNGARDEIKVYCATSRVSALEDGLGEKVFGFGEETFSNTLFLSGLRGADSFNDELYEKLGSYSGATGEKSLFSALERLEKAKKQLKLDKGDRGLLKDVGDEIRALHTEIGALDREQEGLTEFYRKRGELIKSIRTGEEIERKNDRLALQNEQWKTYNAYLSQVREAESELGALNEKYPSFPTQDTVEELERLYRRSIGLSYGYGYAFPKEKENRFTYLSQRFVNAVPSQKELSLVRADVDETDAMERETEQACPKIKGCFPVWVGILCTFVLLLGGLFTFSFLPVVSIVLFALSAWMLVASVIASSSHCKKKREYERALAEKKRVLFEKREKLKRYFAHFGLEYVDVNSFQTLSALCMEYYALCDERAFHLATAEKQKREGAETEKRLADILSGYALTATTVRGAIDEVKRDKERASFLKNGIPQLKTRAERYRRENGVALPERTESTLDLPALRKDLSAVESEIARVEGKLDALSDKRSMLARKNEEFTALKDRYRILSLAEEYLRKADRVLREKYLLPIQDKFVAYAQSIQKTLGERVLLDSNLHLYYEREGELRSYQHLSLGQRAVVDLCLRLALLDELFEGERPFIVLDDPFVSLDETATNRALAVLKEISKDRQILYFCCHSSRKI